jgi:5,10-methylenetetrahydromethanopterin reductase
MMAAEQPVGERSELGLGLGPVDYDAFSSVARQAEQSGFAFVSVGDNPGHLKDTYVSLAVLAAATRSCRIGTTVTNPVHRDPLVVASAASSVESLAPGRLFLGIATGRARHPGTIDQLREHVEILRALWAGKEVPFGHDVLQLHWDARPVPIFICASGPRGLRLAGELADGVIIETGVSPEAVAQARTWLAEGAAVTGRDPADIEQWWYQKAAVADTTAEARDLALGPITASGAHVLGEMAKDKAVPEEFHEACAELHRRYDMVGHMTAGVGDVNRTLLPEGPLREYLFDRFGLVGSPADLRSRLADLRERGIRRVFCAAVVPDRPLFVRTMGEQVIGA